MNDIFFQSSDLVNSYSDILAMDWETVQAGI